MMGDHFSLRELKFLKESFIEALFMVLRNRKQNRCPSTKKWIKKMYIYTMESAVKKKDIMKFEGK